MRRPRRRPTTAAPSDRPFAWATLGGAIAGVAVLSAIFIAVGRRRRRATQVATVSAEPQETDSDSDDDPAFAAYVASLVGPVSPSDLLAPPARPRPRPRPSQPTAEELDLAHIAEQYLAIVAAGSTRPVLDLAARRNWSLGMAQKKLARARAQGILTRPGRGRTGGELTERGGRILAASERRRATEPRHLRLAPPPTDPPAQPFRRRASDLAADPAPKMARDQGGSG